MNEDFLETVTYLSNEDVLTIGLIDSILTTVALLCSRDLSQPTIQEALADLRQDKYLKALRRKPYSKKVVQTAEPAVAPYCPYCADTCTDPDDPDGQRDCRYCGGAFAWRQREAHFAQQQAPAGT